MSADLAFSKLEECDCLTEQDARLAAISKALSHPARLAILRSIAQCDCACCYGDIVKQLPYAQSTVSQHVKVLVVENILQAVPVGTKTDLRIVPETLEMWKNAVEALTSHLCASAKKITSP